MVDPNHAPFSWVSNVFIVVIRYIIFETRKWKSSHTRGLPDVIERFQQHLRDPRVDLRFRKPLRIELHSHKERRFLKAL